MDKFSEKFGYSALDAGPIVEDAPMWLRMAFLDGPLSSFMSLELFGDGWEGDHSLEQCRERFGAFIRTLSSELHYDFREDILSQFPNEEFLDLDLWQRHLEIMLRKINWYEFYDLVELVGKYILNQNSLGINHTEDLHGNPRMEVISHWVILGVYLTEVNNIFEKNNVGWRLDDHSELQLLFPDGLVQQRDKVVEQLKKEGLETTRTHFHKAENFIIRLPSDAPNSIKEIVSALESLGTVLFPNVEKLTLTRMAKELEKTQLYPKHILDIIQKLFDYANSEPGARHGSEKPIRIRLADAEFCFHLGTAIFHYIMSVKKSDQNSTQFDI